VDGDLTSRLADARRAVHELAGLRSRLTATNATIAARQSELARLDDVLSREEKDVRRLKGQGLTAMFATMLGTKETRLSKERAEALKAKLARDACADALAGCAEDRAELVRRIDAAGDPDLVLEQVLEERETALRGSGDPLVAKLDSIDEAREDACAATREICEAVRAADVALDALLRVKSALDSAGNWGAYDLLGGGMIATWAKHSRIDEARVHAHAAQRALDRFAREMKDVPGYREQALVVEIGEFMKFADFLFDGLIADWCVQQRIDTSWHNVRLTTMRVAGLRDLLVAQDEEIRRELKQLTDERRRLVESG
jgi:hypothetical protein